MSNRFGKRLEQLLLVGNIKNSTVAKALKYDVSYISKWITGKAVPSKKNLERVVSTVSDVIIQQAGAENLQKMYSSFGVKNDDALRIAIGDTLRDAYFETTGELNEKLYANNAALRVAPRGQYPFLIDYAEELEQEKENKLAVMVDLFALDHISKLRIAGIDERHFRIKEKNKNLHINYILNLSSLDGNSIYDMILLIHMMTCFSKTDFHLYYSPWAAGRLMIAAKDHFAGVTMIGKEKQFMCTTSTKEKKTVDELYDNICEHIDPDKSVFLSTDMDKMLISHDYLHSLLSQDICWLIGHITEHFLPKSLFDKLRERCFADEDSGKDAERAYLLTSKILEKGKVRILIYDTALIDFVLNGELDFFNHKVMLTAEERMDVLVHLKNMFEHAGEGIVKLIKEGFSDDFKYITNPCAFLSSTGGYLRLENELYEDNLMLIKDESTREKFEQFFDKVWNDRRDVVTSSYDEILRKLENFIETAEVLV